MSRYICVSNAMDELEKIVEIPQEKRDEVESVLGRLYQDGYCNGEDSERRSHDYD